MSLRDWLHRHRWLISARPEVEGEPSPFGEGEALSDPMRFEQRATLGYDEHGRLGDKDVRTDQLDIE